MATRIQEEDVDLYKVLQETFHSAFTTTFDGEKISILLIQARITFDGEELVAALARLLHEGSIGLVYQRVSGYPKSYSIGFRCMKKGDNASEHNP